MSELEERFQQIEQKYGLTLPDACRYMQTAGWMDVNGDNYFWLRGAKWMPLSEIAEHEPEDYLKPDLIPFASEGDGSHWCW